MSPFLSIGVRKQDHHKPKSLSTLYTLITILKSKLDMQGGQATGYFTPELSLVLFQTRIRHHLPFRACH